MNAPVLFERHAAANGSVVGVATLNVPQALNALSLEMIRLLSTQLEAWRHDPDVACVVLRGAGGKAFCAGGDVVALYHAIRAGDQSLGDTFFAEEYVLDHAIHTYPKPILLWGHGIVMGGGVGLMAGASHRVVTERSRIAMPEITIGLYPDVGGSWFLSRLPGRLGIYLGLTGASFNAADALYVGLADFALPSQAGETLLADVAALAWQGEGEADKRVLSAFLRERSRAAELELAPSPIREHFETIQTLTDYDTVDEMVAAIVGYDGEDDWLRGGAQKLAAGSPTSMRLIVEMQRRAKHLSLREAFDMELTVSRQCCRQHDFPEGVRALLVEKDNQPQWQPARLADVRAADIDRFFVDPAGV